jgi:hypothetical protein
MRRGNKRLISLAASLLFGSLASTADAAPTFYGPSPYLSSANSPFSGGSFWYFHTETFEDGALNTPGVTANTGFVVSNDIFVDSVDADDGTIDGSGQDGSTLINDSTTSITFTFNLAILGSLPTAAGIVWTDVGFADGTRIFNARKFGSDEVTFEAFDALGLSLGTVGPVTLGDGSNQGETAEDRFFGVANSEGISSIKVSMGESIDWEVDHLQYGAAQVQSPAVPEPGTLLVFLTAMTAAAVVRRRRRAVG